MGGKKTNLMGGRANARHGGIGQLGIDLIVVHPHQRNLFRRAQTELATGLLREDSTANGDLHEGSVGLVRVVFGNVS